MAMSPTHADTQAPHVTMTGLVNSPSSPSATPRAERTVRSSSAGRSVEGPEARLVQGTCTAPGTVSSGSPRVSIIVAELGFEPASRTRRQSATMDGFGDTSPYSALSRECVGPSSTAPPTLLQASRPPFMTDTLAWPMARSTNHSRGAARLSEWEYTTTWAPAETPAHPMADANTSGVGSMTSNGDASSDTASRGTCDAPGT
mmetsp:Transcript_8040/g.27346  ORF Transcript_8040/g.27346 Transcript_8040/m.27346 type:complete len:202 (+) Transcript_8040:167-772(+)